MTSPPGAAIETETETEFEIDERSARMRVKVDYDVCASTGSCMQVCPEVFEVRSDGYLYVLQEEPPEALHDKVREAADLCPTGAISIEE